MRTRHHPSANNPFKLDNALDGILNINKPSGITSYDVVACIKRLFHQKRVGHAGTLDPLASGVLPVCLGRATRVIEYISGAVKGYRAVLELGIETDTYDFDGKVLSRHEISGITREQVTLTLESFRGTIEQTPPMFSALKHQGQPLYKLAREGIEVERKSRTIQIFKLDLVNWQPPLATIDVECGKGTYIRSLAHDLGKKLGCGAALKELTRTRYGAFRVEDSVKLDALERACSDNGISSFIMPIDTMLTEIPELRVSEEEGIDVINGRPIAVNTSQMNAPRCRAYSHGGAFLAILKLSDDGKHWQPEKVFGQ
jgi:tRNA pseudouridine55 synthase